MHCVCGILWENCERNVMLELVIIFPKHSARTEYGPRNRILRDRRTDNTMYFVFDYIFSVLFESSIMPNSLANCKPLRNCGSQIQRIKRDCNEKKKPTCQPGTTVGSSCYLFMYEIRHCCCYGNADIPIDRSSETELL